MKMRLKRLAAIFCVSIALRAPASQDRPALKSPNERGLRLFDQAVKLSRQFDSGVDKKTEPLKSMLIELSDYHEDEQAGALLKDATIRGEVAPIGPWALARLARMQIQLGDNQEAASLYQRLGDEFKGLEVLEPDSGRLREKAEVTSLLGQLSAIQAQLAFGKNEDLRDLANGLILSLQKNYGQVAVACPAAPCGSYGSVALRALWDLLTITQAKAEEWRAKTLKLLKRESDPKFAAAALLSLSQGFERLGKAKESKELKTQALKKYPAAASLTGLPAGALKNLLPQAIKQ
jgi:hypothetical protein